jgi:type III pantothenate kinase
MQTTLCFDFGNTRLKAAVFNGDILSKEFTLNDDNVSTIEGILSIYNPTKSILSSVINHNTEIEDLLAAKTKFRKLSSTSKLPFTIAVGKPETIGADRLALIAAAVHFYPAQHNLVIVLGSCITYNFVNKFHQFLGGAISPGLEMRFKAMNHFTAKLPLAEPDSSFPLIGYDTKTNLQTGTILGMAKEMDGIIDEYALRYSNFNVHLTGGDMRFFVPLLKNKIFANPQLMFKGLYALSETDG